MPLPPSTRDILTGYVCAPTIPHSPTHTWPVYRGRIYIYGNGVYACFATRECAMWVLDTFFVVIFSLFWRKSFTILHGRPSAIAADDGHTREQRRAMTMKTEWYFFFFFFFSWSFPRLHSISSFRSRFRLFFSFHSLGPSTRNSFQRINILFAGRRSSSSVWIVDTYAHVCLCMWNLHTSTYYSEITIFSSSFFVLLRISSICRLASSFRFFFLSLSSVWYLSRTLLIPTEHTRLSSSTFWAL